MISLNQKLAGTHKELIVLNIFKYKYCVNCVNLLNIGNY